MTNLDDRDAVLKAQGGDTVLISVDSLDKQLEQSFTEVQSVNFPPEYKNVQNVVVCGMGGSRFPALILKDLYKDTLTVPYVINDDYVVPKFVNNNTLVVLSSYSGTTEEVVECGKKAHAMGAKLTGISAGGDTANFLKEIGAPYYAFEPKHNPSGQPRIGFGYSVGGNIGLMMKLGLLPVSPEEFMGAVKNLATLTASFKLDAKQESNPAKQLALKMQERYPYYLVAEHLTGVGNAVQNQTNETAKSISSYRVIPELNHHLMEGLKFPTTHQKMALFVLFFSSLYSSSIQKRYHITKDVIEQNGIETVWHDLKGATKLEQVVELMAFGSYLSMYLSVLYAQDPTAIPFVDYFKKKLKEMK
jgi:glucose/mannose-6-phosphate isomerase